MARITCGIGFAASCPSGPGLGRAAGREDKDWLTYLIDGFIDDDHRLRPLIRTIATSPNFYAVRPGSVGQAPEQQVVQIDNSEHRS